MTMKTKALKSLARLVMKALTIKAMWNFTVRCCTHWQPVMEVFSWHVPPRRHTFEIHRVLVCSTAHVTEDEAQILDTSGYQQREYGWLLWVKEEPDSPSVPEIIDLSPGLQGAIDAARSLGCAYLMFDRDGETLDGLPTYNW